MKKTYFILLFIVMGIGSCAEGKKTVSNSSVKKIIVEKYQGFKKAMEQNDSEFFKNLYTDQAVFYHLDRKTIGNTNIASDFKSMMEANVVVDCKPIDVEVYGNVAFEMGLAIIKNKEGKFLDQSRYIVIWKKEGDNWKIDKDIPIKKE